MKIKNNGINFLNIKTEHVLVDFGRAKIGLDKEQLVEGRKEDIAFLCTWTSAWMDPENKEVVEIMEKVKKWIEKIKLKIFIFS